MDNEDRKMTMDEFKAKYKTLKNLADGNCMFMSVAQLDDRFTHEKLRETVCEFYKDFIAEPEIYPPDSILYQLALSIKYNTETEVDSLHKVLICDNKEYANHGDVAILSYLLDRPFYVFMNNDDNTEIAIQKCNIQSNKPPIRLRYYHVKKEIQKKKGGGDHYEAVLLKSESPNRPSPNTRRSSPKPTKKSSTRKASPKLKKSPKKPSPKSKKSPKKSPKKTSPEKPSPKSKKSPKKSPKKPSPKKPSPKKPSPKKSPKKASPKPKPKSSTKKASISKFINKHPLLGREVAKYFDDDEFPYIGRVASYKHPYYRIIYEEDDDQEDLTVAQTEKIVLPLP